MGCSREQLIARLNELEVDFAQYEHPVVLTVEAQASHVGHLNGALTKNLFLKDKKHRFYIVSALKDTKVDLKKLSQRLGLGKGGGLRMAPAEALEEILQVPLGSVTPFALFNESARGVSLLLDQGIRTKECCFFHPLSNDVSVSLNANGLDKFLNSIGKPSTYVDLEADPPVGKDHLPDLANLVPSDAITLTGNLEVTASVLGPVKNDPVTADVKSEVKAAKTKNASSSSKKETSSNPPAIFCDKDKFVQEILDRISEVILFEINNDSIKQNGDQLGSIVSNSIRRKLTASLESDTTMLENTAYTKGFQAGIDTLRLRMFGK